MSSPDPPGGTAAVRGRPRTRSLSCPGPVPAG
jgi:hypothetical protein